MSCVHFTVEIRQNYQRFDALFVLFLKFGAVLSVICGFLMAVSCWRRILQRIVIVRSFLRLLTLRKLASANLISRGGSYSVSWCVRPWIKLATEYPFNMSQKLIKAYEIKLKLNLFSVWV